MWSVFLLIFYFMTLNNKSICREHAFRRLQQTMQYVETFYKIPTGLRRWNRRFQYMIYVISILYATCSTCRENVQQQLIIGILIHYYVRLSPRLIHIPFAIFTASYFSQRTSLHHRGTHHRGEIRNSHKKKHNIQRIMHCRLPYYSW